MRGAYLAQDRYDLQHAAKELATEMKTPTNEGWTRLKRMGRYLKGAPMCVQKYKRQGNIVELTVDVDSAWAGDRASRKSTLCIVIRHGVNVIKTLVNAMKGLSLSSGEAVCCHSKRRMSRNRCPVHGCRLERNLRSSD